MLTVLIRLVGLHYVVASLFAIAVATVWNYTANSHLTWLKAARRMPPLGASLDRTVEPVD